MSHLKSSCLLCMLPEVLCSLSPFPGREEEGLEVRRPAPGPRVWCLQGQTPSRSIASVLRVGFLASEFQALEELPGATPSSP